MTSRGPQTTRERANLAASKERDSFWRRLRAEFNRPIRFVPQCDGNGEFHRRGFVLDK